MTYPLSPEARQQMIVALEFIADREDFTFAECSLAEEIVGKARAALGTLQSLQPLVVPPPKLWLWKNFVDGRPEYWAFDNPYPINLDNGDPQTLGEPCGYALFKPSRQGRTDVTEERVIAAIKRAQPQEDAYREALTNLFRAKANCHAREDYHGRNPLNPDGPKLREVAEQERKARKILREASKREQRDALLRAAQYLGSDDSIDVAEANRLAAVLRKLAGEA